MDLILKVWRQNGPNDKGHIETYPVSGVSPDMSFLEMMDMLNDQIIRDGGDPVAFDHDCREGICGMCSMFINGEAHGPNRGVTTCLSIRLVSPWMQPPFPCRKRRPMKRSMQQRASAVVLA